MERLQNKTAIIAGASEGIGGELSKRLYKEGMNLVLIARRKDPLDALAAHMDDSRIIVQAMDVRDYDTFSKLLIQIKEKWGGIHYLVNNAAAHFRGPISSLSSEQIETMVNVNLTAPIVLSRLCLDYFLHEQKSRIVNIASLAGRVPLDYGAIYSATKFGLRAFSYAVNAELNEYYGETKSIVISPGPVDTKFVMNDIDKVPDLAFSQPISTPEEVVDLIVKSMEDGKMERVSGGLKTKIMTNIAYAFPELKKLLAPIMKKKGQKVKEQLKKKYGH